jgi:hypothetical protein
MFIPRQHWVKQEMSGWHRKLNRLVLLNFTGGMPALFSVSIMGSPVCNFIILKIAFLCFKSFFYLLLQLQDNLYHPPGHGRN